MTNLLIGGVALLVAVGLLFTVLAWVLAWVQALMRTKQKQQPQPHQDLAPPLATRQG